MGLHIRLIIIYHIFYSGFTIIMSSLSSSFPIPTWDTPFGIQLWPIFDKVISQATNNKFIPSQFQFISGHLPLSTLPEALMAITIYYIVIFGGDYIFKNSILNHLF